MPNMLMTVAFELRPDWAKPPNSKTNEDLCVAIEPIQTSAAARPRDGATSQSRHPDRHLAEHREAVRPETEVNHAALHWHRELGGYSLTHRLEVHFQGKPGCAALGSGPRAHLDSERFRSPQTNSGLPHGPADPLGGRLSLRQAHSPGPSTGGHSWWKDQGPT